MHTIFQISKNGLIEYKVANIFQKFDLKAGFWQVKMEEESIPWTAFTCPQGHYEWLVMPLGLKNAPALFQRKMQNFFNENQEFVLVYIDDLLIFLKTYKEHIAHS